MTTLAMERLDLQVVTRFVSCVLTLEQGVEKLRERPGEMEGDDTEACADDGR
jgi:hypothetical protein